MPIGGDKTGSNDWYQSTLPLVDKLYDTHLEELRKEGTINGKKIR